MNKEDSDTISALLDRIKILVKENKELKGYTKHNKNCPISPDNDDVYYLINGIDGEKCTCGLDELLKDSND